MGLLDNGQCHFPGFLKDAPNQMGALDLLVHPSIRESFGNVLIEAGLAGLAVVASNVDGCAEVVVDGETGILVECNKPVRYVKALGASPLPSLVVDGSSRFLRSPLGPDPNELAKNLIYLIENSDVRKQMGRNAAERMRKLFNLDRYVKNLERAYERSL
jgi:glycosyltransferase involved in cell wall biosynthesis